MSFAIVAAMSSVYGPVPSGVVARVELPSTLGLAIIPDTEASTVGRDGYGLVRWSVTVFEFTTVIDPRSASSVARPVPVFTCIRSAFTAAALNGVPSTKLMPVRSVIVKVTGFTYSHD